MSVVVYIAQVLCPKRHCILALAGEADDEMLTDPRALNLLARGILDQVQAALDGHPTPAFIERGIPPMDPWCGVCHAPADTWKVDIGELAFATLAEAKPALDATELQQIMTRMAIDEIKRRDGKN